MRIELVIGAVLAAYAVLMGGIFIGKHIGYSDAVYDIRESCKQSQEYRFNEKEAMTCNITTLEIKGK